jgi:hypothetical protein
VTAPNAPRRSAPPRSSSGGISAHRRWISVLRLLRRTGCSGLSAGRTRVRRPGRCTLTTVIMSTSGPVGLVSAGMRGFGRGVVAALRDDLPAVIDAEGVGRTVAIVPIRRATNFSVGEGPARSRRQSARGARDGLGRLLTAACRVGPGGQVSGRARNCGPSDRRNAPCPDACLSHSPHPRQSP